MTDEIFSRVNQVVEDRVLQAAIGEYVAYIGIMHRIVEGEQGDFDVTLSPKECAVMNSVRYDTDHFLTHLFHGSCREPDGRPVVVVPGMLMQPHPKIN
jgi:hypothetical protein